MTAESYTKAELVAYSQPAEKYKESFGTIKDLVAYCARVSNPSNQFNTQTSDKLITYLLKHKHFSPFEMASITLEIETTRDIARQLLRHRSMTFQEFCVAEGTKISTVRDSDGVHLVDLVSVEDLYEFQHTNPKNVCVFDEESGTFIVAKIKEVFKTGLKPVSTLTLMNGKSVTSTKDHKFLTRDGFKPLSEIVVGDAIGCNCEMEYDYVEWSFVKSIVDVGVVETYDMEVDHSSHNYVANGIVTHNSQRYADPTKELNFVVREARLQDVKNRQNSIANTDMELESMWEEKQKSLIKDVQELYTWAVTNGIAKEQARAVLPEGLTMSRLYAQGTIRTFIHYLDVRTEEGTQLEHRILARKIAEAISIVYQ